MAGPHTAHDRRVPVVLVVDDEDYVADMIASALDSEGYVAHVAYNGRDGLAQAQQISFDLVIVDIMMPYMSGIELVSQMRQIDHLQTTPVVMISAGARPRTHTEQLTFVPKPFDMDDLLQVVAQQLNA